VDRGKICSRRHYIWEGELIRAGKCGGLDQRRGKFTWSVVCPPVFAQADLPGVAKAMTAFLSGEMRDTVEIVSLNCRLCSSTVKADYEAPCWFLGS
jgi:hypothetical protein